MQMLYLLFHHVIIFLSLEKLISCAAKAGIVSACRRFTQDKDGFLKGKTITEAADIDNHMEMINTCINAY